MKKISFIFLLASLMFFSSCSNDTILKEFYSTSDLIWEKSDKIEYTVNIDENLNYDLIFPFRYVYGSTYKTIFVNIDIESPTGKKETIIHKFDIMDDSNKYIGKGIGDIWDLETKIKENYKFTENGNYKFAISHNMPQENFAFVMEVGLIINIISAKE